MTNFNKLNIFVNQNDVVFVIMILFSHDFILQPIFSLFSFLWWIRTLDFCKIRSLSTLLYILGNFTTWQFHVCENYVQIIKCFRIIFFFYSKPCHKHLLIGCLIISIWRLSLQKIMTSNSTQINDNQFVQTNILMVSWFL